MKKIISGIAAGFVLLSAVGVAQAIAISCGDGSDASSPLCRTNDPLAEDDIFDVRGVAAGETLWVGSAYAAGYDYWTAGAPNFASMSLVGAYEGISISTSWDETVLAWTGWTELTAGTYNFGSNGASTFGLSGIPAVGGDLFVTGLTFVAATGGEAANVHQLPNLDVGSDDTGGNSVPEPATAFLLASGLLGFGLRKKQ